MVVIENHGALILSTDYWQTDAAKAGKVYCSCNAGTVRILLPNSQRRMVDDMRSAKYVILSRGPWKAMQRDEAVELLFEDETQEPFSMHLSVESFDMLPAKPMDGQEWVVSVWMLKEGKPKKTLERPCKWRMVDEIPCLEPWGES
jgi:hypothetical protein